jgi:uncharacterized protein YnzC (UPF0291/DUF896 family)|tara:strand:+ start:1237 stop:1407 length:171 start_codon:yes stop_codon:yes gene_type:complete
MDMNLIEKINMQYANEKAELLEQLKSKEISKDLYENYLQQLVQAYNMDIVDATLEN